MISNSAGNYRGIRYLERSKLSLTSHFVEILPLCLRMGTLVINHKEGEGVREKHPS